MFGHGGSGSLGRDLCVLWSASRFSSLLSHIHGRGVDLININKRSPPVLRAQAPLLPLLSMASGDLPGRKVGRREGRKTANPARVPLCSSLAQGVWAGERTGPWPCISHLGASRHGHPGSGARSPRGLRPPARRSRGDVRSWRPDQHGGMTSRNKMRRSIFWRKLRGL